MSGQMVSERVLVAMSGGVDSSVAVKVLRDQGFECAGATMELLGGAGAQNVRDAADVAAVLGIPHDELDFSRAFRCQVMDAFAQSYLRGETPNPCLDCNRLFKFGAFLDYALEQGFSYIATGHYARIEQEGGLFRLRKGADANKDQSYVLYALTQRELAHVLLPLGGLRKEQIRALAAQMHFGNADKPESQDICFVPDGDYAAFVERSAGTLGQPGNFVDAEGRVLGQHQGIARYTVGQRKGLGLCGPEPLFICAIRPETNEIVVGTRSQAQQREFYVRDFNWIAGAAPGVSVRCAAKVRYRQTEQPAAAYPEADGLVRVVFDEPQGVTAPGQAAVLYDGEYVIGGGRIH